MQTWILCVSNEKKGNRKRQSCTLSDRVRTYSLSSNGVFTKYVVRIPFPFTGMGPRHSSWYPAAFRTLAVFSVVCGWTNINFLSARTIPNFSNCLNIWWRARKFRMMMYGNSFLYICTPASPPGGKCKLDASKYLCKQISLHSLGISSEALSGGAGGEIEFEADFYWGRGSVSGNNVS